ncbi:hypothetical protein ABMA28_009581 [Loxostege sticticalis]|uniref:Gag-like protein n=1 Tax=Loxostege sticticalis TaxID=481309 RepID=A0ABD0SCU3_LOXSC
MVRRLTGEWEAGKPEGHPKSPASPKKTAPAARATKALSQDARPPPARRPSVEFVTTPPRAEVKYTNRLSEAKAMLTKAKLHLRYSKNLRTDIKLEVTQALERLYQLVKESEQAKGKKIIEPEEMAVGEKERENRSEREVERDSERERVERELLDRLKEHTKLIDQNRTEMEKLKEVIESNSRQEREARATYASVAAVAPRPQYPAHAAVHSVVITSSNEKETGDQVLEKVRKTVNAKEEGYQIERIRKARDHKIILGCSTKAEMIRVKDKIVKEGTNLKVEEIKNKDPLIIIKNVLKTNTEEDILKALRTQNQHLLQDLGEEDYRAAIRYKKNARNPHQMHVVLSVSPKAWSALTAARCVHIDMQRLRAEDQSPLIQCSRCLGYGHTKKTCRETEDLCAHCGGPHLRSECAEWLAAAAPTCKNCIRAKMSNTEHNAFSADCPVRSRWEMMARSTVAYC